MGNELKWLLKEGGGVLLRTPSHNNRLTLFKSRPTYLKVGPPKYSKIQTQQICNIITNSITGKQYSKNRNLYK